MCNWPSKREAITSYDNIINRKQHTLKQDKKYLVN